MASGRKILALELDKIYTKENEKRIPKDILKETIDNEKWFLIGFYAAGGNRKNKRKILSLTQKH